MVTTIQIDEGLKDKLDNLKIHHRETYNELLSRLINCSSPKEVDRESLIETIEVLSDAEMMQGIVRGLKDFEEGKFKSLEQLKRDLKLNA